MSKFLTEVGLAKTKSDTSKLFDARFIQTYAKKANKA